MKGLVVLFISVLAIAYFSFAALSVNREYNSLKEHSSGIEFRTFTSAVCEDKNESVYCKDELFVNCNGKIAKSGEILECNGMSLPQGVSGSAVFEKDWKDPRI